MTPHGRRHHIPKPRKTIKAILRLLAITPSAHAQVPQIIHYQGRVAVQGVNFEGSGQFKFALVSPSGMISYWSNDGTSAAGGIGVTEPTEKLEVEGTVKASAFVGDGSGLTTIPASAVLPAPPGMVRIPAGPFTMGAGPDGDPIGIATISAFYLEPVPETSILD